jgi:hypothetical protein
VVPTALSAVDASHPTPCVSSCRCYCHYQKADSVEKISAAATNDMTKAALEYRRCIVLGLVGSTSSTNPALERILESGYLDHVKTWLEDILSGTVGESFLK